MTVGPFVGNCTQGSVRREEAEGSRRLAQGGRRPAEVEGNRRREAGGVRYEAGGGRWEAGAGRPEILKSRKTNDRGIVCREVHAGNHT